MQKKLYLQSKTFSSFVKTSQQKIQSFLQTTQIGDDEIDKKYLLPCGSYQWEYINCLRDTILDAVSCKQSRKALQSCEIRNYQNMEIFLS